MCLILSGQDLADLHVLEPLTLARLMVTTKPLKFLNFLACFFRSSPLTWLASGHVPLRGRQILVTRQFLNRSR